jgi:hypothetical protein
LPIAEIKTLSEADRNSIMSLLAGPPSPLWAQALTALAVAGTAAGADSIRAPLALKEPSTFGDAAAPRCIARFCGQGFRSRSRWACWRTGPDLRRR